MVQVDDIFQAAPNMAIIIWLLILKNTNKPVNVYRSLFVYSVIFFKPLKDFQHDQRTVALRPITVTYDHINLNDALFR